MLPATSARHVENVPVPVDSDRYVAGDVPSEPVETVALPLSVIVMLPVTD